MASQAGIEKIDFEICFATDHERAEVVLWLCWRDKIRTAIVSGKQMLTICSAAIDR
jgi:hypothetical protein